MIRTKQNTKEDVHCQKHNCHSNNSFSPPKEIQPHKRLKLLPIKIKRVGILWICHRPYQSVTSKRTNCLPKSCQQLKSESFFFFAEVKKPRCQTFSTIFVIWRVMLWKFGGNFHFYKDAKINQSFIYLSQWTAEENPLY